MYIVGGGEEKLGSLSKKNTGFFGSFSQMSDPPPLFGRSPSKKKFKGLFCVLGPKERLPNGDGF